MSKRVSAPGKCTFCQKTFSKTSITKHLNAHLAQKAEEGKPGRSFHIKIETNPRWGSTPYFLMLWVDGNTTLQKIDTLLRQIWLECCGHMSAFRLPRNKRQSPMDFFTALSKGKAAIDLGALGNGEIAMNRKVKDTFYKDLILEYEYDFGSTTALQLTVAEEFNFQADEPVILLSRNERLNMPCESCGKRPAVEFCTVCTDQETMFCAACAKKHAKTCDDFADYAAMPVVNSPRMGVCAYTGGQIDTERD